MLEVSEELKKAFMADNVEKQIRVTFPDGEHEDITNEQIEAKSFNFTESLCSQDTLKFGLCEANVIKFNAECDDISGHVIAVFIDAYYQGEVYTLPYGVFTVKSCKRRAGTRLRSVEAYSEGITQNDTTLSSFENWKLQNSISYSAGTIYYGFRALMAEKFGRENINGNLLNYDFASEPNVEFIFYSKNSWSPKITARISYYRVYDRVVSKDADNLPIACDFSQNRLIQNKTIMTPSTKEKIEELLSIYRTRPIISGRTFEDLITPQIVLETISNGVSSRQYFRMKEGEQYYPYLPNAAQGTSKNSCRRIFVLVPNKITMTQGTYDFYRPTDIVAKDIVEELPTIPIKLEALKKDSVNNVNSYTISDDELKKISIYNLLNGFLELQGLFAKCGRSGEWEFFSINDNFKLYPQENIFPNEELYPLIGGNYQPLFATSFKAANYEEFEVHKYGYVRVTYLASDNEKYSITVTCDPRYDNVYEMRDNYILLSKIYTADQIKQLIETIFYPNIKDITYNPAQVSIKGLPFLEAGDVIKVHADDGNFKTFLFRRTQTGEQSLTDSIATQGQERHDNADVWIAVADVVEKE